MMIISLLFKLISLRAKIRAAESITALTLFLCASLQVSAQETCQTEVLQIPAGPVCGMLDDTRSPLNIEVFRGMPYAQSVTGENRWTAPKPRPKWTSTLVASRFGSACAQSGFYGPGSEECLFINVWRPKDVSSHEKLSVMVFIHGGGFYSGSSSDPLYDGARLASKNVIFISFNYRLGALGFLTTASSRGSNYGLLDQQLALRWVQDNVGAFGGDPARVTLVGESAGAISIGLHLTAMPESKKLFSGAIMESNLLGVPLRNLSDEIGVSDLFTAMAGCSDVQCLKNMNVKDLVEASDKFRAQAGLVLKDHLASVNVWGPIIDDQAVRLPPLPVAQDTPQKPVLIGFNQYEGALFVAPFAGQPASFYPEWLYSLFGKNMKSIMRAYPLVTANPVDPAAQVFTDYVFDCSSANFASGFAQAYRYEFTHQPSFKMLPLKECNNKACHTTELPFVFGNAELLVLPTGEKAKFTADEIQLSDSMQRYWTNFAKTGNPSSGTDVPVAWPLASATKSGVLKLAWPIVAGPSSGGRQCEMWNKIGYPPTGNVSQ